MNNPILIRGVTICTPADENAVERVVAPLNNSIVNDGQLAAYDGDSPPTTGKTRDTYLDEISGWPTASKLVGIDFRLVHPSARDAVMAKFSSAEMTDLRRNSPLFRDGDDTSFLRVEFDDGWTEYLMNRT